MVRFSDAELFYWKTKSLNLKRIMATYYSILKKHEELPHSMAELTKKMQARAEFDHKKAEKMISFVENK